MKRSRNNKAARGVVALLILIGLLFILPLRTSAISIFSPFGGKVLTIAPIVVNPLCPANVGFVITVSFPKPIVANLSINAPPFVRGGVAKIGSWTIGLVTPPVPPCLPIVTIMGVN